MESPNPQSRKEKSDESYFSELAARSVCGDEPLFLLPTSLAQAEERPGDPEIKTLKGQIVQLRARLDQNPGDYEALQGIGIAYHDLAITDSKAYAQKAVQYLEKAYQNKPDNNIIFCYLGSAYTLLAKDVGDRSQQANYVNKGFEDMDKAVRKDPDNIAIRMVRGNNSRALPRFLNRRSIAYEDFQHLAGLFEKGVQVPPPIKILCLSQPSWVVQKGRRCRQSSGI